MNTDDIEYSKDDMLRLLDWISKMVFQTYVDREGVVKYYLSGSPIRFTTLEVVQIWGNSEDDDLHERWLQTLMFHEEWSSRNRP